MTLRLRILLVLLAFSIVPAAIVALVTTTEAVGALEARIAGGAADSALRAGRELDALLYDAMTALDRQMVHDEIFEHVLLGDQDDPNDPRITQFLSRFRSSCPIFADVICLKDQDPDSASGTAREGRVFAASAIEGTPARFVSGVFIPAISTMDLALEHAEGAPIGVDIPRSCLAQVLVLDRHVAYRDRVVAIRVGASIGDQPFSLVGVIEWSHLLDVLAGLSIQGDDQGVSRVLRLTDAEGKDLYLTTGVADASLSSGYLAGAHTTASGWKMRVFIDSDTARAPVSGLLGSVMAIVLVVIVLTALLSRLIAKWLADPVAAEMAKKHAELQGLNESLAGANQALEDTVSERTDALREAEQARANLTAQLDIVRQQQHTIRALSVPAIQVWDRVLMVPLIGEVDAERAQIVMEELLQRIAETRTKIVLMDVTGVDTADTQTAFHFIKIAKATRLMGAQFILTGVRAHIARTLVNLDISFEFVTRQILSDGLRLALTATGWRIVHDKRRHEVERDARDVQSDDEISPVG